MLRARFVLLVFCIAFTPRVALAQGIARTFDELRLLIRPGDTVTVTDARTGADIKGKVFTLSPSSLILTVDSRQREWREGDLSVIHQNRGDSLRNGALWGFGIGGILGFVAGAALGEDSGEAVAAGLLVGLVYGGLGAGAGAGIDALVTTRMVIYQKQATARVSMGFAPILARSRTGAALVIRF